MEQPKDILDEIDNTRFYNEDGYSLLLMFESNHTLVIDVCSPEMEEVGEGNNEFIPKVVRTFKIEVND